MFIMVWYRVRDSCSVYIYIRESSSLSGTGKFSLNVRLQRTANSSSPELSLIKRFKQSEGISESQTHMDTTKETPNSGAEIK